MFSPASHPSTVNSARKCSQIIARGLQGAAGTMESSSSLQIETQQGWEMSPHPPTRSMCDGWPDQKLNTPWGPWRHIKATRAGQALGFLFFFKPPLFKAQKMCDYVLACFNLHSTASLFSKKYVSPAPYQKKVLPILPLCILDTQVLVLAVDRWKNSPTPCLTMTYLLFSTRVWIWSAGKVSSSCCKSAWLEPGGKHS